MKLVIKLCVFISLFFPLSSFAQKVIVPNGVIYHSTDEHTNENAKKILREAINKQNLILVFDTPVMCGPNLWDELLQKKIVDPNSGIELNFRIPDGNNLITKSGRIIKKSTAFSPIWKYICSVYADKKFTIRKLTAPEIAYYWSIISYEIEEPLFIVEYTKQRLLINLNNDKLKLLFIEFIN